jgi:dTDP-4-amino-4,6-dideoxygalactose transaminase
MTPFNKPYLTGKEFYYLYQSVLSGKISGDGLFTKKCHDFFESVLGFQKVLLTTSCTDALEMAAILINIQPGDEVIMSSFTFVSSANAFVLRGASIIFTDCEENVPNVDVSKIETLITPKTKAIVAVHYAGISCDMDPIMDIAARHNLYVIEDAAQGIDSFYKGRPVGTIGHLAAFSFHETKNIISGEGGLLAINESSFVSRAEIIREKGTNRSQFFRGEVDKYGWIDIGSSFLPSDIIAAFLFAQLEHINDIQARRRKIWTQYFDELSKLKAEGIGLPNIPEYATNNAHMFYLVCRTLEERTALIEFLKSHDILSVSHYLSLNESPYYELSYHGPKLTNSQTFTDRLVRLPLFYELRDEEVSRIAKVVINFFESNK